MTFLESYKRAFDMPLDQLEELMLIRNALAAKQRDEARDGENNRPRK